MSADNVIIILKTEPKEYYYEYRVKEQSDSNAEYCFYSNTNDDAKIKHAREIFKDCQVFNDFDKSMKEAIKIMDECMIVEYGITEVYIPRVF
jgi:uncharacterized protein YegL